MWEDAVVLATPTLRPSSLGCRLSHHGKSGRVPQSSPHVPHLKAHPSMCPTRADRRGPLLGQRRSVVPPLVASR